MLHVFCLSLGVTGPLVRAAHVYEAGVKATALPGAVAPGGAGAADEPWEFTLGAGSFS